MNWRPNDWKNPYRDKPDEGCFEYQVFERGADAMLEALRGEGERIDKLGDDGFYSWTHSGIASSKGYVVFIPDD